MRTVDRRKFLKYCVNSAAALGLSQSVVGRLQVALAADAVGLPAVIWLACSNCTGCTVSLANRISTDHPTDIADLLVNTIDLAYHPNLMGAAGDLAVDTLYSAANGQYVLAIEGGIPTAFGGNACMLWTDDGHDVTAMEAVQVLAPNALAILSIGTCAAYGGIPGGPASPTGVMDVRSFTGRPAINIPGCPVHPDWVVWTIAQLLAGTPPALDAEGRPTALYARSVHDRCPRKGTEEADTFAEQGRCLKEVGCKGPETRSDCPTRLWNGGANWCIGANSTCIGCTSSKFPHGWSSFYKGQVV